MDAPTYPITPQNVGDWFPAPTTENPLAGEPWWQIQSLGLLVAVQLLRLVPAGSYQQQALIELRRALDTALLTIPTPDDDDIRRRLARTLAPWCPSPYEVVELMLNLAQVQPGEHVLDLGSGDGRIVLAAARRGAFARGIEIDALFVTQAQERCAEDPAYRRASFVHGDVFTADWGTPDVITCYLVTSSMNTLARRLRALRPGTRIVSHGFGIADWPPFITVEAAGGLGPVYLWVV